jgi:solute carrier family 25 (mitochondrial iron transporter), member 28/37
MTETSILEDEYSYEELPEGSPLAAHLTAGAMAGIMEHCLMYPMDMIKTRMQVLAMPGPTASSIYSGVSQALSRVASTEGMLALWRGVNSVAFGAGPAHAIYFATYEKMKRTLIAEEPRHIALGSELKLNHHPLATALAGAAATIASDAVMNPFDVIKQRLQIFGSSHRGMIDCVKTLIRTEGLKAFYVSYPTTLMMTIPFQSIHFTIYEYFRKVLNPTGIYDPKIHIVAGALAGGIAAAFTTPLDVAKTLLQTRGESKDLVIRQCNGVGAALKIIYLRKGLPGFFQGIRPRIFTHMPSTAICWTTYEYFKWILS